MSIQLDVLRTMQKLGGDVKGLTTKTITDVAVSNGWSRRRIRECLWDLARSRDGAVKLVQESTPELHAHWVEHGWIPKQPRLWMLTSKGIARLQKEERGR